MLTECNFMARDIYAGGVVIHLRWEGLDPTVTFADLEEAYIITSTKPEGTTVFEIPALKLPIRISCSIENAAG